METVNLDFGGPYPDGHYNLVIVDQRSRYPVVEEVHSTSFKETSIKLKEIFATNGTLRKILTDNDHHSNRKNLQNSLKKKDSSIIG